MAAAAEKMYYATGRRKTSSARVYLKPGKGNITINGKKSDDYLTRLQSRMVIMQPLDAVNMMGKFDLKVMVAGGGESGRGWNQDVARLFAVPWCRLGDRRQATQERDGSRINDGDWGDSRQERSDDG